MAQSKQVGRPTIKPKRHASTVLLNHGLTDKIQLLQIKRGGCSVSDLINEAIINLLKKESI